MNLSLKLMFKHSHHTQQEIVLGRNDFEDNKCVFVGRVAPKPWTEASVTARSITPEQEEDSYAPTLGDRVIPGSLRDSERRRPPE